MADEKLFATQNELDNAANIERLRDLNIKLAQIERQKQLNELTVNALKANDELVKQNEKKIKGMQAEIDEAENLIKHYKNQIQLQRDYIKLGDKGLGLAKEEIEEKKISLKTYKDYINTIKTSNNSFSSMTKNFKEVRKAAEAAGYSFKDIRSDATFGRLFKNLKSFNIQGAKTAFATSGGLEGVVKNTFPALEALGTKAALAGGALAGVVIAGKMFYDNIVVPSARMRNIAGQQLGLAAGSRNLWGGHWIHEWSDRTLLGYSAEEQQGLYSSLVDALRINPNEEGATEKYQNAMRGMMANQRLFGTSTGSMNKIYKAFDQTGVATAQLSEKFYTLMRGVEGTGWTTSEYSDTLARNIMYLKNFGINIDTYSKNLLNYGQAIKTEILTPEEISPKMRGEGSGEMAFIAQQMLKSGVLSEKTLGAGLGDSIFKQSGALRKLAFSDPQRFIQLLYKLYTTDPRYKSLLMNAGVWGDETAMWEFMYKINAPGMGALSEMGYKGPNAFFQIAKGNLGSTPSTGLGDVKAQPEIVSDAMRNVAQMTSGFKGLLTAIASMITDFSKTLPEDNPKGF